MDGLLNQAVFAAHYKKRLAVIVPYRNRPKQLAALVARLARYFQRDKLDRHIPVTLHIVEPTGRDGFNAGKVRNCGYMLVKDGCDYVCFHDVDYLPIWADYSWSEKPARLCWYGLRLKEDPDKFFGAVVLFDKKAFERVNGYPNVYWGWGSEDLELGIRCKRILGGFEHRDGTYLGLPHKHRGFAAPGVMTEEARKSDAIFKKRIGRIPALAATDGLSSTTYKLIKREKLTLEGKTIPNAFHYLIDIGKPDA